ncbi:phosphoinositide phospholipase C [Sarracenia purpurea var. burkii]
MKEMGSLNYKMFGCFNRKFRITEAEPPPDVKEAFAQYAGTPSSHMSVDQFLRFLVEFQGEQGCSVSDADRIIRIVLDRRHTVTKYTRHGLSLDDFFDFLFFDDLNGPIKLEVPYFYTVMDLRT